MSEFKPYIESNKKIKEFSFRAIFFGIIFGFIFCIGNAYLGLKTGTTISASIPAAIMSVALFRCFKKSTILENNIVQTIASVGEAMAAGVIFTIPALYFLDEPPSVFRVFILSALGGILGILFMIPMRRYIIVDEHKVIPFPEGTACAEILKAGENKVTKASIALISFFIGAFYKICTSAFFLWEEIPRWTIAKFEKTQFSIDATPALLGVGYIIGPRIAGMMLAGGVLSWWVIIPLIHLFGSNKIIFPSEIPVLQMSAQDIWGSYVRYIGAGAVAMGGMLSLVKVAPLIVKTIRVGIKELAKGLSSQKKVIRTDEDISMAYLILGSLAVILALWLIPATNFNFFTIILLTVLGFIFVAITSITVGLVGSSSNPTSGMTLTTLLITSIIFVLIGWTDRVYLIAAITMSCVANVAIAMAATTSQDLKTGYLLGSTPKSQQIAEIIGVIIPAAILGFTIYLLNHAYTLGSINMPAPQAVLMSMIAKGVIQGQLPFILVGIGIVIAILVAILRIPVLPFAMGLYLPLSLSTATMVGALVAIYVNRHKNKDGSTTRSLLISSGLIGGDAFTGVFIALLTIVGVIPASRPAILPSIISLVMFILLALYLAYFSTRKTKAN